MKTVVPFTSLLILLILISDINSLSRICGSIISNLTDNACPINAQCKENGYCQCLNNYIGLCDVQATPLFSNQLKVQITSNFTYFQIYPDFNNFIVIQFTICHDKSNTFHESLNIWYDDGNLKQFNSSNSNGKERIIPVVEGCFELFSPYFKFNTLPNGESESLIFGIKLFEEKEEGEKIQISIKVNQTEVFTFDIIIKIISALAIIFFLFCIGSIAFCYFKIRRTRRRRSQVQINPIVNNLQYINHYMPKFIAEEQMFAGDQICSICLAEINANQTLRKTICHHVFHSDCLDSWCLKNLTCPVCRLELNALTIQNKMEEMELKEAMVQSVRLANEKAQITNSLKQQMISE